MWHSFCLGWGQRPQLLMKGLWKIYSCLTHHREVPHLAQVTGLRIVSTCILLQNLLTLKIVFLIYPALPAEEIER